MARWRLATHLRRHDWVAVLVDLFIVVAGVFLGIQASNWNDQRKDRATGRAYLARIADDLRFDLSELKKRELYWTRVAGDGDRALNYAEQGKLDRDQWTTLLDFFEAGQIWNYSPTDGAYREMLSSGRLDLIRDNRLKSQLTDYYIGRSTQAHSLLDVLPLYRDDIRAAVPYRFQRYILDHCEGTVSFSYAGQSCAPPADQRGLAELNRSLASNSKLMGELRDWMTTLRYARGVGQDNAGFASRLLAEIDEKPR